MQRQPQCSHICIIGVGIAFAGEAFVTHMCTEIVGDEVVGKRQVRILIHKHSNGTVHSEYDAVHSEYDGLPH